MKKQWWIIPYTKCMAFGQVQFWRWDSDLLWLRFNCTCSLIFLNLELLSFAHFLLTISVCLGGLWERSWCSLTSWSYQTWTVAQRVQSEKRWLWTRQENVSSWKAENFDHEWKKLLIFLNPFHISILLDNKEKESQLYQKKATKQKREQKSRLKYHEVRS